MTPNQLAAKIRDVLSARVWPGGEAVFGGVHVSPRGFEAAVASLRTPCAFVHVRSAAADTEAPDLVEQTISILVADVVAGDETGQNLMLGGNRTGGTTASKGRGILEIEEQVKAAVQKLGPVNGVRLLFVSASDADAVPNEVCPYAGYREYSFRAWCTTAAD